MQPLSGRRVVCLVGDDYEDLELWYPVLRLQEAGAEVVLAGQEAGRRYVGKNGYPCVSDRTISQMRAEDVDGLVIPGGWMPDKLRRDPAVLELTRHVAAKGKLVASICHGPWILISAGLCRGVRMTSTPGIRDDLVNAGADWVDEEVVVDRRFVTSRRPSDLPAFGRWIVEVLARQEPDAGSRG
jgi:protease I